MATSTVRKVIARSRPSRLTSPTVNDSTPLFFQALRSMPSRPSLLPPVAGLFFKTSLYPELAIKLKRPEKSSNRPNSCAASSPILASSASLPETSGGTAATNLRKLGLSMFTVNTGTPARAFSEPNPKATATSALHNKHPLAILLTLSLTLTSNTPQITPP